MSRHYVLTLQLTHDGAVRGTSTQHGPFEGDDSDDDAFLAIWQTACDRVSPLSPYTWTTENTAVLFYRLGDPS